MKTRIELPGIDAEPALQRIAVGDLVKTAGARLPSYAVVALYDDMAWVRDVDTGAYGLASLAACRKVAGNA